MCKYLIPFFVIILIPFYALTQEDSIDIYGYNLIELSKLKINTVSKVPQEYASIPATMHIVSAEEIHENGYFTLDEALACLPGFQFRNTMGYNSYIFQRGIPSQNNLILVLIDGIQINELNSGGFYAGAQYNLENVERIEVVYGPASVVYGTNAVSGIINIITKKDSGLHTSLLGGSFETYNANLSYGFEKSDYGVRVSGMIKSSEKANLRGKAGDNNWTDEMENYEKDYSFDAKAWHKNLTIGINYLNKQTPVSTFYPSVNNIYQDHGTLWNILFCNAYLKYKKDLTKHFSFSSNIYNRNATVMDNSIFKIVDTTQVRYFRPNNLTGIEGIFNYSLHNKLDLVTGITYESEHLSDGYSITYSSSPEITPPVPTKPTMLNNNLLSIFFEGDYKIGNRFSTVGGLRFDNSSTYDQVVTPRISLIYKNDRLNSKLLYAEAFRAPKPWDYSQGLGNRELLPERMKSMEFLNRLYLNKNLMVLLSVYKNILNDAITKEVLGEGDDYRWINQGKIETDGIEFMVNYSNNTIKIIGNYTYNNSYNEDKVTIPEIAKHSANMSLSYRLSEHLRFNLRANYLGKRKNTQRIETTNSNYTDPALILNGVISFLNFHNFDIQLITKNILNKEYYHTSNRLVERYRQPQRTILLKLTYQF